MEKWTSSASMGGYGLYVWPSFIIAAVIMLAMVMVTLRSLRKAQRDLSALQETASLANES